MKIFLDVQSLEKKLQKTLKKHLTNGMRNDIIYEFAPSENLNKVKGKFKKIKTSKNFEKVLDKRKRVWYNN